MKSLIQLTKSLLVTCFIVILSFSVTAASVIEVVDVKGWVIYRNPAYIERSIQKGKTVERGGRLFRKSSDAQVILKCEDSQTRGLTAATSKSVIEICEASPNSRLNPEQFLEGGYDSSIPYIISPRYTQIENSKPTLKWNAIQGVDKYEVTICEIEKGRCMPRFESVKYSASKKDIETLDYPFKGELEIGKEYKLVITTKQNISSELEEIALQAKHGDLRKYYAPEFVGGGVSALNFKLLERTTREKVLAPALQSINRWQESNEIKDFGIIVAYENNYLYSEAIERLESLLRTGSLDPFKYIKLGDLYAKRGLNLLAQKAYEKAVKQAEVSQDEVAIQEAKQSLLKLEEIKSK